MKTKQVKDYIYEGLGFPVYLEQAQLIYIEKEWHLKIDVRKLATKVIKSLVSQDERLTGNQVKFIRTYFSMSLRQFAQQVVRESHTAVSKWEAFKNQPTNMDANIEIMLRLFIIEQLESNTVNQQNRFFKRYLLLRQMPLLNKLPPQLRF